MENGLFKRGQLPKRRQTPTNKQLRGGLGHIAVSSDELISPSFGEAGEEYRYGQPGAYFNGDNRVERQMVAETSEFRESTETLGVMGFAEGDYTGAKVLPKEAKALWRMLKGNVNGMLTDRQKKDLQDFILDNHAYQMVANELVELRNKQVPNNADRRRKIQLEQSMGVILTHLTRTLRSE